ncbi:tetratricopeptide repeat protein [Congregibacter sp.]|uniref:tetratricopeptide repeat protein n=1 Tax=Congregibacter sp. TaxID=2744308 RepID=UPI00385C392F
MSFYEELKRRNVFRVGVAYAVSAWALLQVVDLILDNVSAPDWVVQVFMLAIAIGFPFALLFAWVFEMTPDGVKLEKDVDPGQSITPDTGRKLNLGISVALAIAVVLLLVDKFSAGLISGPQPAASNKAEIADTNPSKNFSSANSIAVLPFVDMSQARDQQYLSDGIAEEILHELAQVGGLLVTSRSSSFTFRDKNLDIPSIAAQLGVGFVLEGSLRRAGDRIRITAQLIQGSTDKPVWSESYDRELNDIFAIQDELSLAVVIALKDTLGVENANTPKSRQVIGVEAYDLYLKGLLAYNHGTVQSLVEAKSYFEQTIDLEPGYARAWDQRARTLFQLLGDFNEYVGAKTLTAQHANFTSTEAAALKAAELAPNLGGPHTVLSLIYPWNAETTLALRSKAISLSPNDPFVVYQYGRALEWLGRVREADEYLRRAVQLDPLNLESQIAYARFNMWRGRTGKAQSLIDQLVLDKPEHAPAWSMKSKVHTSSGNLVEAMIAALRATQLDPEDAEIKQMIASLYMALGDIDATSHWVRRLKAEHPTQFRDAPFYDYLLPWLKGQHDSALQVARTQVNKESADRPSFSKYQLIKDMLRQEKYAEAESALLKFSPELTDFMSWPVVSTLKEARAFKLNEVALGGRVLQFIYQQTGRHELSDALVDRLAWQGLEEGHFASFTPRADQYLTETGKQLRAGLHNEALAALETAVKLGYRKTPTGPGWQHRVRDDPLMKDIRQHPRFVAVLETIEGDMVAQRAELNALLNGE